VQKLGVLTPPEGCVGNSLRLGRSKPLAKLTSVYSVSTINASRQLK